MGAEAAERQPLIAGVLRFVLSEETGQGEVFLGGGSLMLLGDDVV